LGVDPKRLQPAQRLEREAQPPPVLRDMITTEEPNKSAKPRTVPPSKPAPPPRPSNRFALVLSTSGPAAASPPVRTFPGTRRALDPGPLQVVVVPRPEAA